MKFDFYYLCLQKENQQTEVHEIIMCSDFCLVGEKMEEVKHIGI